MSTHPCQSFVVSPPSMDYLYHPVRSGWSVWDDHALDLALRPLSVSRPEIESVWLSCIE